MIVIVPDTYGLTVVDLDMFVVALADGVTIDEATMSAGIDQIAIGDAEHVQRIRQLNETGDATAYWDVIP